MMEEKEVRFGEDFMTPRATNKCEQYFLDMVLSIVMILITRYSHASLQTCKCSM